MSSTITARRWRRVTTAAVLAAAAAAMAPTSGALAADPPDLSWTTIDSGGSLDCTAPGLRLSGTIGQGDLGAMIGGDLSLEGGFWPAVAEASGCMADWDGNGVLEPADIALFVNTWFNDLTNGTSLADLDGNGFDEPSDIAAFVNAWFTGLSNGC